MRDKAPNIRILTVREQKIVIDSDLAAVYGVTTKRLNEQFRRNRKRFPEDFAFQLSVEEYESLRAQIATLNEDTLSDESKRSQNAILKTRTWPAPEISAMGIHRTRRASGSEYSAKRSRYRDERICHSCVYRITRKNCREHRDSEAPGRNR